MRVAVITPYFKETLEVLERCHRSVKAQSHLDVVHYIVADGCPNPALDAWDVQHVKLPKPHGDYGDTPRAVGAIAAGYEADALCLLDADNWLEPDHIKLLCERQKETGAAVVTATRMLRRLDGSELGVCSESNGKDFNDTNCYLFTKPAMLATVLTAFKPGSEGIVGDRYVWNAVRQLQLTTAHCSVPTVNYTTTIAMHYVERQETPPPEAKVIVKFAPDQPFQMVSYTKYCELTRRP